MPKKIIDLGCATGEFLSYVRYRSPQLRLVGVDASERFIDAARKTFASDDRSTFVRADIFQAPECLVDTFDSVFCLGTLSVFEDFRPVVDTMISLLSSKGVAILEGYFCPLDFEVDVVWRNTSDIHSSGPPGARDEGWRRGFKRFAKNSVIDYLHQEGCSFQFFELDFCLDLPKVEAKDIRAFTLKLEGTSSRLLVNDLGQIVNSEFCVFWKNK